MKTRMILLVVLVAVLLGASAILAQPPIGNNESVITVSANFISFMRATTGDMAKELETARRNQDPKKSDCIASRLVDLRRILGESEMDYKNLREASFDKKPARIREEFTKILKSKNLAEQLVKVVNECYGKIGESGGFTETVEQYLGREFENLPVDFGAYEREDLPEPRPPQYEPEPISKSTEH